MLTKEKIAEILREKYPYLIAKYGVKRLGLFGSYARGEQTEDSDVDLVAEFERPIGLKFIEFAEQSVKQHIKSWQTNVAACRIIFLTAVFIAAHICCSCAVCIAVPYTKVIR